MSETILSDAIMQTITANELSDARIRLTLTGGPTGVSADKQKGTLVITTTPFEPYPAEYYEKGAIGRFVSVQAKHRRPDLRA